MRQLLYAATGMRGGTGFVIRSIRQRVLALDRRELIGALSLAVLVVGAAGFWYLRSLPTPVAIETIGAGPSSARRPPAASSPSPAVIVVDVAGWVKRPGVYEFRQGDRVIDAVRRAGGALRGADLTSLNLASLLADAQQVLVGRRSPAGGDAAEQNGDGLVPTDDAKVNVNTATLDELETLPGIGEVLAQRIIDHREAHGPFRTVEDLLDVSGIGDARLADISSKVTV